MDAEVSTRHLSFVENGRSRPSQALISRLARGLQLSPRDENALLLTAGFAPTYRETDFDSLDMAPIRETLKLILDAHAPFSAVVVDRRYDLLMSNGPATRLTEMLCVDREAVLADGPPNLLRLTFHPKGLRPHIVNWPELARAVIGRTLREASVEADQATRLLLSQLRAYEGIAEALESLDPSAPLPLLVPTQFRLGEANVSMVSTITTLGTAHDITLQELRIETFYPADDASAALLRAFGT